MSASFDDAEFDALGEPDTDPLGPDGAGSPSAPGERSDQAPGATDDAGALHITMPCPLPRCGHRVQADTIGGAFKALQAHLEAAHDLTPTEPAPEPAPAAQLVLPDPYADLAALFDAPIDPQTGEAVIRMPEDARREVLAGMSPEAASAAAGVMFIDGATGGVIHPNEFEPPEDE